MNISACELTLSLQGIDDLNSEMPVATLPSLMGMYGKSSIDVLKIDCEGCEHAVLKASHRIKDIDMIVAEFHINSHLLREGHSFENLKDFLRIQNPNIIIQSVDINMHEA